MGDQSVQALESLFGKIKAAKDEVLDKIADLVIESLGQIAPEAIRGVIDAELWLREITRHFEQPGHFDVLLGLADRLIRMGHDHPIIVCGMAQALVDISDYNNRAARTALTVLEKHKPNDDDDPEWRSLYLSRIGRAEKDWFWASDADGEDGAEQHLYNAYIAYRDAAELGRKVVEMRPDHEGCRYARRMNETNQISLGREILDRGFDIPDDVSESADVLRAELADIRTGLTDWLKDGVANIPISKQDAWDAATLLQMGVWDSSVDADEMKARLQHLLKVTQDTKYHENTPEFIIRSAHREFDRSAANRTDPRLSVVLTVLENMILETEGASLTLDADRINASREEFQRQATGGGGDLVHVRTLKRIVCSSLSICSIRLDEHTIGTGFLMQSSVVFREDKMPDECPEKVILTAAHVSYDGDDAPWEFEGGRSYSAKSLIASFDIADGRPRTKLCSAWQPSVDKRAWLDASVLIPRDFDNISHLPALSWDEEPMPKTDGAAYVVGFPMGREMQVALHNIGFVDSPLDGHRKNLVRYLARTDPGQSGAPVLVTGLDGLDVHALHFMGQRDHQQTTGSVNVGVLINAIRKALNTAE